MTETTADPGGGCQHAGDGRTFCGEPAHKVRLPDGGEGWYCDKHEAIVIARVKRRLK